MKSSWNLQCFFVAVVARQVLEGLMYNFIHNGVARQNAGKITSCNSTVQTQKKEIKKHLTKMT